MRKSLCCALICAFILLFAIVAQAQKAVLLHRPAASSSQLVFSYGDDLWSASHDGGPSRRRTSPSAAEATSSW